MEKTIQFTVNGQLRSVTTDPQRPLLDVLREDLKLTGAKFGCGESSCGACTVLIDGKPARTCRLPVAGLGNATIVTIEGLAQGSQLHPVQEAFLEEGAFQCSYCTSGMILAAVTLLERNSNPVEADIRTALNGHLCRCCSHVKIVNAVRRAAALMKGKMT